MKRTHLPLNGLRVFDMRTIMDLDPDGDPTTHDAMGADTDGVQTTANVQDKTKVGRHNNVWYSFGYRYVMPQVAAWKFKATQSNPKGSYACVSTGAPKASYISLDRSTTPDRLLMGEYCRPQTGYPSTGRIASYPVAALEGRTADVTAEGWANYLPLANGGAQVATLTRSQLDELQQGFQQGGGEPPQRPTASNPPVAGGNAGGANKVLATTLSALLPGAGQLYAGEVPRGLVYLGLNSALAGTLFYARFYGQTQLFYGAAAGLGALNLVAPIDAFLTTPQAPARQ